MPLISIELPHSVFWFLSVILFLLLFIVFHKLKKSKMFDKWKIQGKVEFTFEKKRDS